MSELICEHYVFPFVQVRPGRGGIKLSAAKDILEKLARNHDLPKVGFIIEFVFKLVYNRLITSYNLTIESFDNNHKDS